jgi:hypothetical protein
MEPATTSIGVGVLATFLSHLPEHIAYHVVGGEAHHKYRDFMEGLGRRLVAGNPPVNEHLEHAVRNALSGAALVFAYTFHDPNRKLLGELVRSRSWTNLKQLAHQITELVRRNIIVESTGDKWLTALIEQARDPHNFSTFDVHAVLKGNGAATIVGSSLDEDLREHVHKEFLRWIPVGRAPLSRTPDKPAGFDASVTSGIEIAGGHRFTFYDLFRLFFREELKESTPVHRALVVDVLAELKADVAALVDGAPSASERRQLRQAIEALGNLADFGEALAQQNREWVEEARGRLTRIEHRLDYAIAGLPIQPFRLPDAPTHEIDLLKAKHRAVGLVGRDDDLGSLWRWLLGPQEISARLMAGGAGSGKTRLALELLLQVNDRLPHWQAGMMTGSVLRRFDATKQPADWRWPYPTLIVVDYAQTLFQALAELLRALTHRRRTEGNERLRILLLERQAGDWFDALKREEDSAGPCSVGELFDPHAPVNLTPLPPGEMRRRVFEGTLAKASELTGRRTPSLPADSEEYERSLARSLFAEPLNLMLSALASMDAGLLPALKRERIDLAEAVARKEIDRIKRFARATGNEAQERLLCHLAACATLERGFTADELHQAVAEERDSLQLEWPGGNGDLADVLKRILPGEASSSVAHGAIRERRPPRCCTRFRISEQDPRMPRRCSKPPMG